MSARDTDRAPGPPVRHGRTARQTVRMIGYALAPAGPAALGAAALVALFWVGHLGVKQAVNDGNLLAEAETHVALALLSDDPAPHVSRAMQLLGDAGEPGMGGEVTRVVTDREMPAPERLDLLGAMFGERRAGIQHSAEVRFLTMASAGMVLMLTGAATGAFFWRRRWAGRWERVRRLSDDVEALARAPLDATFEPSGIADELGRVEDVLARVAPQLADTLVHQQRLSLLGEQVAFVAHDIRNPLGTISMGLSLLPEGALDPELRELLIAESRRANALADELRDFARRSDALRPCDLACEIEASARLVGSRANQAGVTVTAATGTATVLARGNELRQLLINLIENAIDAAAASPVRDVVVSARTEDGEAVIRVEDSGPGVPPSERARLFESFYSQKEGGSGMGLAITRRIVESLGGRVEVEGSAALGGASFIVRLPPAVPLDREQCTVDDASGS